MNPEDRDRLQAASAALSTRLVSRTETRTIGLDDGPDVPNRYGTGFIAVETARISYHHFEDDHRWIVVAQLSGTWRVPNGELTNAPMRQDYGESSDDWPDWLTGLAWDHHPDPTG